MTGSERSIGPAEAATSSVEISTNAFGLAKSLRNGGDELRRLADAVDDANPLAERHLGARRRFFAISLQVALERVELLAVDFFRLVP